MGTFWNEGQRPRENWACRSLIKGPGVVPWLESKMNLSRTVLIFLGLGLGTSGMTELSMAIFLGWRQEDASYLLAPLGLPVSPTQQTKVPHEVGVLWPDTSTYLAFI